MKRELEVEYVMQYIGMQKQIVSIWKIIIKTLIIISHVFRCKQLVWMGNVKNEMKKNIPKFDEKFIKKLW